MAISTSYRYTDYNRFLFDVLETESSTGVVTSKGAIGFTNSGIYYDQWVASGSPTPSDPTIVGYGTTGEAHSTKKVELDNNAQSYLMGKYGSDIQRNEVDPSYTIPHSNSVGVSSVYYLIDQALSAIGNTSVIEDIYNSYINLPDNSYYTPATGIVTITSNPPGRTIQALNLLGDSTRQIYADEFGRIILGNDDVGIITSINPLSNETSNIIALEPIRYKRHNEATGLSTTTELIGLIAQDVETYFPEVVGVNTGGSKVVNYSALTAVAIQGIKEANTRIDNIPVFSPGDNLNAGIVTATGGFVGDLSGKADEATKADEADVSDLIVTTSDNTNTFRNVAFLSANSGNAILLNNSDIRFNPSIGELRVDQYRSDDLSGRGSRLLYADNNGRVRAFGNVIVNEVGLTSVTAGINSLNPISFNYDVSVGVGTTTTHYGFDCDELDDIYPDLVGLNTDGSKTIDYNSLTSLGIQGLQESNVRITNLENTPTGITSILESTSTTRVTNNTTSYVTIPAQVTINKQYASSKILIIASASFLVDEGVNANFKIRRDSTTLVETENHLGPSNVSFSSFNINQQFSMQTVDPLPGTGNRTYTLQFAKASSGGDALVVSDDDQLQILTVMEIN